VIAKLDERKRQLVHEAQQLVHRASDEFFEFMDKGFMLDLALRFFEDSVAKARTLGRLSRELHLHANVARTDRRQRAMIVWKNKGLARIARKLTKVAGAT
jgi:hypothetical protein